MFQVVGQDGQIYGPVNDKELKLWYEQGRLTRDTAVIDPISSQSGPAWMMLKDYEIFPMDLPPVASAPLQATPPQPHTVLSMPQVAPLPMHVTHAYAQVQGDSLVAADLGPRFLGWLIDGTVALPLVVFGAVPFIGIFVAPLLCLYWLFRDAFFGGQSIGKRVLGMRVVHLDGRPIRTGQSFLRNIIYLPLLILMIPYIGDVAGAVVAFCALLDGVFVLASRRRMGDRLAQTIVVRYST